jgi:hypothetical protein
VCKQAVLVGEQAVIKRALEFKLNDRAAQAR